MYLRPCRNCPHKVGCEMKAAWLQSLCGLGLTLVDFKCEKRLSKLQPGQRVILVLWHPDAWYSEDDCGGNAEFKATVMRPYRGRLQVWLDVDGGYTPHKNPIAVRPDRVTPIGGTRELCPECSQPKGTKPMKRADGGGNFRCLTCEPWKGVDDE